MFNIKEAIYFILRNHNPEIFENLKIMRNEKYSGTMNYTDWSYKNFRKKVEFSKRDYFTVKKIY